MSTEYVLEGQLRCQRCQSYRHPAPSVDGRRFYACAPGSCTQPPTGADWVEQHAILAAIVHMDGVLRHGTAWRTRTTPEERTRWARVDASNKRCLVTAAFVSVEITTAGEIRFVWRHHDEPGVAC
ncbi:MAG: hypothetical protein ACRDT8_22125 [Micromonosporaceae bacterium]